LTQKFEAHFSTKVVAVIVAVALVVGIFAGYYASAGALNNRVGGVSEELSQIETALSTLKGQYDDLSGQLSDISTDISELKSSLSEVKGQYVQLSQEQTVLQKEAEDISADISELQSKVERKTADMIYEDAVGSVVSIRVDVMDGAGTVEGTGFVFSSEGYIVTNSHVVEDFDADLGIEVTFTDGTAVHGEFVAADPDSDLAVLKASLPEGVEPLTLGDSAPIKIGEPVIVIGNPFGLEGSLVTGVVSQTHRIIYVGSFLIPSVIQVDATINPGCSGGPLLNYEETVIGVIASSESNIGFAVPSNIVKRVVTALIEKGEYKHAYMGITMSTLDLQAAEDLKLNTTKGVRIISVTPGAAADEAGLGPDDVIIQMGNVEIRNTENLVAYSEEKSPSDTVNVTVLRDNTKLTVPITFGERPSSYLFKPEYCNVEINASGDQTATLSFSYRSSVGSGLWLYSVKDRPNWDIILADMSEMAEDMLIMSNYEVLSKEITDDDFWMDGAWHSGGAWLVSVHVNLTESPNWQISGEESTLTINDPWQPEGFLDAVNITSTGLSLDNYSYTPASATDLTAGSIQDGYLLWLNTSPEESPKTYIIVLQ